LRNRLVKLSISQLRIYYSDIEEEPVTFLPKLEEVAPDVFAPSVIVEMSGYVYITVRIHKSLSARNVYWHLVDPIFSLLELGFEMSSRRLTHISIPVFKGPISTKKYILPACTRGDPLFNMKEMALAHEQATSAPEVIKHQGRISLNRSGDDIDILLENSNIMQVICCQDKVAYGFNVDGRLCLIRLCGQAADLQDISGI
jgi:hypothetical protein